MRTQPAPKGPAGSKAYWPEYALDYPRERQNRARIHPKPHEIAQADAVLVGTGKLESWVRWLEAADPALAKVLMAWAIWMSHDCYVGTLRISEEEFARTRLRTSLATLKRHRDRAARLIAVWLQKREVRPWEAPKPRGGATPAGRSPRFERQARATSGSLRELRETLQSGAPATVLQK